MSCPARIATCILAAVLCGAAAPTPSPSAPPRETLGQAWWTGPMLAPSAGTLPRGHVLIEPYVYDVAGYGSYNRHGTLTATAHSNSYGSLTYIIYGLTNRLSIGAIPTFGIATVENGPSSSGVRVGDLSLSAQYGLTHFRADPWVPATAINVQETFPTGKYDRLGDNPTNGFGSGAYTTTVSIYTQSYFWMRNGRILRVRLNASQAFSSRANVNGVSVYGTDNVFHGSVQPGRVFTLDLAQEYSVTQNWVLALDIVYRRSGNTAVAGPGAVLNSGTSEAYMLAPALEYNWTPNAGILIGLRTIPAGVNTSASLTPAIAINFVR